MATTSTPSTNTGSKPLKIIIASKNPVKINAALHAITLMFPPPAGTSHTALGVSVPSGVPDQPLTDASTLLGAQNRAHRVMELEPDADFWVGIEGGVDTESGPDSKVDGDGEKDGDASMTSFAWVVVLGRDRADNADGDGNGEGRTMKVKMGKARTATYYLPKETAKLVRSGMELGHADEVVFGTTNSKQKNGSVGLLTGDVVDRRGYYEQAAVLAMIPFRNNGLIFA